MSELLVTICAESTYIAEIMFIFAMYRVILQPKEKYKHIGWLLLQVIALYLAQKTATTFSIYIIGRSVPGVCVNIFVLIILTRVFYQGKWWKAAAAVATYTIIALLAELLACQAMYEVIRRSLSVDVTYMQIVRDDKYRNLAIIFCGQLLMILMTIICLLYVRLIAKSWKKEYVTFLLVPVYQFILFLIYYSSCSSVGMTETLNGYVIYLFGLLVDGAIYYFIRTTEQKQKAERELQAIREQRRQELAYYTAVNRQTEEMRSLRHEFANQLQIIQGLLKTQETEDGKNLLEAAYQKALGSSIMEGQGEKEAASV